MYGLTQNKLFNFSWMASICVKWTRLCKKGKLLSSSKLFKCYIHGVWEKNIDGEYQNWEVQEILYIKNNYNNVATCGDTPPKCKSVSFMYILVWPHKIKCCSYFFLRANCCIQTTWVSYALISFKEVFLLSIWGLIVWNHHLFLHIP